MLIRNWCKKTVSLYTTHLIVYTSSVAKEDRFEADLAFLGNRLPDREKE
jgi:hypothetical protein